MRYIQRSWTHPVRTRSRAIADIAIPGYGVCLNDKHHIHREYGNHVRIAYRFSALPKRSSTASEGGGRCVADAARDTADCIGDVQGKTRRCQYTPRSC